MSKSLYVGNLSRRAAAPPGADLRHLLAYIAISDRLTALEAKQEAQFSEIQRFMQRIDQALLVLQQQERARRD